MTIERAREILGRLSEGKSDEQIAQYIMALDQIAKIAARGAERQFKFDSPTYDRSVNIPISSSPAHPSSSVFPD